MQIFLGAVAAYLFVVTFIGPEQHGADFEHGAVATEEGAGKRAAGFQRTDEYGNYEKDSQQYDEQHDRKV